MLYRSMVPPTHHGTAAVPQEFKDPDSAELAEQGWRLMVAASGKLTLLQQVRCRTAWPACLVLALAAPRDLRRGLPSPPARLDGACVLQVLPRLLADGHRVLIFSQYVEVWCWRRFGRRPTCIPH